VLKLSRLPTGEPEIFASIQGEGVTAGLPSVFVRLALCNLACAWCDTSYTWDWTQHDPRTEITHVEIDDIIRRVVDAGPHNVVITGGEPLLQQEQLVGLTTALRAAGLRIEVETNGTLAPLPPLAAVVDQWNVSPKLASSGNEPQKREVPASLRWFAAQPSAYFKFVVVSPEDLGEVRTLVDGYGVPPDRVLLMPEGTAAQTLCERSQWLVERCCELGYRFSTRLHIMLWGDQRGR
jgi:7-carboxy-7-deazaguanine synthase